MNRNIWKTARGEGDYFGKCGGSLRRGTVGNKIFKVRSIIAGDRRVPSRVPHNVQSVTDYAGNLSARKSYNAKIKIQNVEGQTVKNETVCMKARPNSIRKTFIEVLPRFVSRHGDVADLYDDKGTNLVAVGDKELKELLKYSKPNIREKRIFSELANRRTAWHFQTTLAPILPHLGGCGKGTSEALSSICTVPSVTLLTFNASYTVLVQIEAANSRPLTDLSHDPNNLSVPNPNHFLISEGLRRTDAKNTLAETTKCAQ